MTTDLHLTSDMSERSAVVTGATGDLGHVVVRRLLARGAHVAVPVRDMAKADELREAFGDLAKDEAGPRLLAAEADVADRASMDRFVERVLREWGRLDILANLVGGFATGAADDIDTIRRLWAQNIETAITVTAACLKPMRARGYGRIVSVGSTAALKGNANAAGYSMAKTALVRWTESLAAEVRAEGVTANIVLPATIDSPANRRQMPKVDPKKWATPEEVAALILFLASDEASGVTGAAIPITART